MADPSVSVVHPNVIFNNDHFEDLVLPAGLSARLLHRRRVTI